jgi:hypothetical protein
MIKIRPTYSIGITLNVGNMEFHRPMGGCDIEFEYDGPDALTDDEINKLVKLNRKVALRSFVEAAEDCIQVHKMSDKYERDYPKMIKQILLGEFDPEPE